MSEPAAIVLHMDRLRHDLGKYVTLQQSWLPEGVDDPAALAAAVRSDLVETRRGPHGATDAVAIWDELREPLLGRAPLPDGSVHDLSHLPDVAALQDAMEILRASIPELARNAADPARVRQAAGAARTVTSCCRNLARLARTGALGG